MAERYGADFPMKDFLTAVGEKGRAANEAGVVLKAGVVELLDHLDAAGGGHGVRDSAQGVTEGRLGSASRCCGRLPTAHRGLQTKL